jgi:hypothetical protein
MNYELNNTPQHATCNLQPAPSTQQPATSTQHLYFFATLLLVLIFTPSIAFPQQTLLIEAESFAEKGGWVIDQQFMDVMGSPYLLAHGLGKPVEDAYTNFNVTEEAEFRVFVRTKNWNAEWNDREAAGKFMVKVDSTPLENILGDGSLKWSWEKAGSIKLEKGIHRIALQDLTGFDGRCDALVLTSSQDYIPPRDVDNIKQLRIETGALAGVPENAGNFDLVVIGGGMAGTCAAISAARLGVKVALIQNRPVLGGNNSSEVRVHLGARIRMEPYPNLGNLVNEIGPDKGGNAQPGSYYEDDKKIMAVLEEENITLFLNYHANEVTTDNGKIISVTTRNIENGRRIRFTAPLFADCTGDGTIGVLAGADYMEGRESRDVFGEETAPEVADKMTMGASVQWYSKKQKEEVEFPDIKWGLSWNEKKAEAITRGDWMWETGMGMDMVDDFERIRDYGLLVVYSNWSYIKNNSKHKKEFAREELDWVAYIAGKRESRRLRGDYVLVEQDLTERRIYPDGTVPTTWSIDLHYPDPENSRYFPGEEFKSIAKHINIYPYPIPFRCLYSVNIDNLMMAGRNISVSHVALGTTRLMRTTGMMGEVLGMAASICKKENTTPRGIYLDHFDELKKLMEKGTGNPDLPNKQDYNLGGTLLKN